MDSARRNLQRKCDMFSNGLKLLKQINGYQEEHTSDYSRIASCDQVLIYHFSKLFILLLQSLLCIVPGNIESTGE